MKGKGLRYFINNLPHVECMNWLIVNIFKTEQIWIASSLFSATAEPECDNLPCVWQIIQISVDRIQALAICLSTLSDPSLSFLILFGLFFAFFSFFTLVSVYYCILFPLTLMYTKKKLRLLFFLFFALVFSFLFWPFMDKGLIVLV